MVTLMETDVYAISSFGVFPSLGTDPTASVVSSSPLEVEYDEQSN